MHGAAGGAQAVTRERSFACRGLHRCEVPARSRGGRRAPHCRDETLFARIQSIARAGVLTFSGDRLLPIDLAIRDWARRDRAVAERLRRWTAGAWRCCAK